MNSPLQQIEIPITDAGVCKVKQALSGNDDQRSCILTLEDAEKEDMITKGMNLESILCAIGSSRRQIQAIKFIGSDGHSRCLCFLSTLLPVHIDLDQRPLGIHLVNINQEQLWMAADPKFAKHVHSIALNVPWQLKPGFWTLLMLQDFISQAVHLEELTVTHSRPLMDDEEEMLHKLSERGVNVVIRSGEVSH